jgi:hypothetical protein
MKLDKLIYIAVKLALLATISGQFPFVLRNLKISHLKLLEESKASKWQKAWVP